MARLEEEEGPAAAEQDTLRDQSPPLPKSASAVIAAAVAASASPTPGGTPLMSSNKR